MCILSASDVHIFSAYISDVPAPPRLHAALCPMRSLMELANETRTLRAENEDSIGSGEDGTACSYASASMTLTGGGKAKTCGGGGGGTKPLLSPDKVRRKTSAFNRQNKKSVFNKRNATLESEVVTERPPVEQPLEGVPEMTFAATVSQVGPAL
jgi:hypothetical protein